MDETDLKLKRDCEAIQIPLGHVVTLPAGTPVDITQTLGGNYTVQTAGGLFRIAAVARPCSGTLAGTFSGTRPCTFSGAFIGISSVLSCYCRGAIVRSSRRWRYESH